MLNKDELFLLGTKMDFRDLLNFCCMNKRLYNDKNIWNYKINEEFPESKTFKVNLSPKDKYILLKSLKTVGEFLKGNMYDLYHLFGLNLSDKSVGEELLFYLGNLPNMRFLYLDQNNLKKIPRSFSRLTDLQILDISSNKLEEIPDSLSLLKELVDLKIDNNKIRNINHKLGNITSLKTLSLSHNEIIEIPKSLENLTKLDQLYLDDNEITELPEIFENLTNLEILHLEDNLLTKIPNFSKLEKLRRLYLWRNGFIDQPIELPIYFNSFPFLTIEIDRFTNIPKEISSELNIFVK